MIDDRPALLFGAYETSAAGFARSADRLVYTPLAQPLVAAVTALLDEDDPLVLDVAAGSGAFGRSFSKVVALDVAGEQLRHNEASRRVRADGCALPFPRGAFAAAGCAFAINHVVRPEDLVTEMARVAPVVGVSTWLRPEEPFAPKSIVRAAVERQVGTSRTPVGELLDHLSTQVGSVEAVTRLLAAADLDGAVTTVEVVVPWPGAEAYLDYRLSMPSTTRPTDQAALRREVVAALAQLSEAQLAWRPLLVIGAGRRRVAAPPRARPVRH